MENNKAKTQIIQSGAGQLFRNLKEELSTVYDVHESQAIAFQLLEDQFDISRTQVLTDSVITYDSIILEKCIEDLKQNKPIQYITGKAHFFGLEFFVNSNVLIPRQETEELVDLIIKQHGASPNFILDIGTGSGCIPVTLKKYLPTSSVFSLDISEEALKVAKQNAQYHEVAVTFIQQDILTADLQALPLMDIIVSNPPYVREEEKNMMLANVLDYEPHLALFVPDNKPLLFYKKIAEIGLKKLKPNGWLYFEINEAFGIECLNILKELGYKNTSLIQDMQNKDRIIKAQL